MAKNYSISGSNASQAAPATVLVVAGGTACRTRVFDIVIGSSPAPADNAALYQICRVTSIGTSGSNPVIYALDPIDVTSLVSSTLGVYTGSASGEPSGPVALLDIPLNMRATFRYVASPGAEFINVLSATNGISLRQFTSSATFVATGTLIWAE